MPVWLGALVGVPALLVAAKAHGRQVRLEREAAGYRSVQFGGENPEFVERLWRRDRVRFWSLVPPLALVAGAACYASTRSLPLTLVVALLWSPIVGFAYAGVRSYQSQAGRGGIGWWALTFALAAASIVLAIV